MSEKTEKMEKEKKKENMARYISIYTPELTLDTRLKASFTSAGVNGLNPGVFVDWNKTSTDYMYISLSEYHSKGFGIDKM